MARSVAAARRSVDHLDLDDMRLLVVLADELHFGRAAARLHISQPGLSYRVKRMEESLGYELVSRVRRAVELTPAGLAVVEGAHRVLDAARQVVADGERAARGEAATVRLGFVGTALYSLLPDVMREVRRRHPELRLVPEELKTAAQVRALRRGALDMGLVHLTLGVADLVTVPAWRDRVGLALPADHRLAGARAVDLADLADDPFVLFPRDLEPQTHDRYVEACVTAGFAPRVAQTASGLQAILGMVAAGVGAAFVASSVARNMTRTGVAFVDIDGEAPTLTTGPAWREPVSEPGILLLRDVILGVAAGMAQPTDQLN